nr:F-box/kelch-repeat protein At3g23880-like [Ipomoea batatas]
MEVVHIPIEIIRQILLNLEVKAVIRFQSVCKEWLSTIQNPHFKLSYSGRKRVMVVAHSSSSCLALTSITTTTTPHIETPFLKTTFPLNRRWSGVWCSCNGLVLFSVGKHINILNPLTKCSTKVLESPGPMGLKSLGALAGLCYDSRTRDYKVVLLLLCDSMRDGTAMVASLRNKQWQKVSFPFHAMSVRDSGVNFRNTLHWRVAHSARDWCSSRRCKKVVYFDTESDEFKELPIPTFPVKSSAILGLGIIDGDYLCMAREKRKETGEVEVLVMKEYGVKDSWISQFVISGSQFRSDYHRDFTFYSSKYSTQVLIGSCLYGWWGTLVYHFKNKKLENFLEAESGHKNHTAAICSYVQSFVSPQEFSWRDDDDEHKNDYVLRLILKEFNI